jgi:hypothetical protein
MIEKIIRESKRVGNQIARMPKRLAGLIFNNIYHDLFLRRRNQITEGMQKISKKIAIYLIFPANGIDEFHERTLEELLKNCYSTVIVSNAKLPKTDLELLKKYSLRIIERANYGYDFGGYREGILASSSILKKCKKLLLINDSTIFPLQENSTWIIEAESSGWDFTGSMCINGYNKPKSISAKAPNFGLVKTDNRDFHYPSFAIMLGESIAQSKCLQRYFRSLKLSSIKKDVIKRGEIGLSKWAIKQGFSHGGLMSHQDIFTLANKLSNQELLEEIKMAITPQNTQKQKQLTKDLQSLALEFKEDCKDWRSKAITSLANLSIRFHPGYTLAHMLCTKGKLPFLKKGIKSKGAKGQYVYNKILETINTSRQSNH